MKLKEVLKQARQKKGLSQAKLAKVLGYSTGQFVSNWERGQSYPPVDRLAKLAILFDLNKEDLIELYILELATARRKDFEKAYDFHMFQQNQRISEVN